MRNAAGEKEADLYSIKREINSLNASSAFDDFEKESIKIGKAALDQVEEWGILLKIKSLASDIGKKKGINERLHSLHFSLNLGKNNYSAMGSVFEAFLRDNETGIGSMINELNDFKSKLHEIEWHHSKLLPKSLDNKIEMGEKYGRHLENLHSVHKKQKKAFMSLASLFLRMAKNHLRKSAKI